MMLSGKHKWARDPEVNNNVMAVYCLLYYYENREYVLACIKQKDINENIYNIFIVPDKCCDNIYLKVMDNYHRDYSRWYNRDVVRKTKENYLNILTYIGDDFDLDTAKLKAEIKIANLGY